MSQLILHLPLPPTINQTYAAWPVGKKGEQLKCRIVQHQNAKDYKEMVRELAALEWYKQQPFEVDQKTRFALYLYMFLEKNSRDVDANIKLVMDGVMAGIKDATGLKGLSDLRVFEAGLEKHLIREQTRPDDLVGFEGLQPEPGLTVEVIKKYHLCYPHKWWTLHTKRYFAELHKKIRYGSSD